MAKENVNLYVAIQELINEYKPMLEANYENYYYHLDKLNYEEQRIWVNGRPHLHLSGIIETKARILADDYKIDQACISHWIRDIRLASKGGTINDVLYIFTRLKNYLPNP